MIFASRISLFQLGILIGSFRDTKSCWALQTAIIMLFVILGHGNKSYLPSDPSMVHCGVHVGVMAAGTPSPFIPDGRCLPQYNIHLEYHA
jgi:hypothetical protein